MKKLLIIAIMCGTSAIAQNVSDQNPNHARGMSNYMEKVDDLTQTQGTTIQDTYEAIDDTRKAKRQARRTLRRDRRHELRMARANNPGYFNRNYWAYDTAFWLGSAGVWGGGACYSPWLWR